WGLRPPARVLPAPARSGGGFRRPAMTTWAPAPASSSAVARPMPVPPPVTIATCPSRALIALAPREHRLLEVVDARRAPVDDDLAHLVDHRRGRPGDERAEERP